jgi:hypothetical protein
MDMIGRIRRLHSRGKKSEREISRMALCCGAGIRLRPLGLRRLIKIRAGWAYSRLTSVCPAKYLAPSPTPFITGTETIILTRGVIFNPILSGCKAG